jgi:phosphoribosyl 1,2-cyclic phosphate phosphodiesterase
MLKTIILGCGSSAGVPIIGCKCKVCLSDNIRNKRTRSSILIKSETNAVIVDTGPDLRSQSLQNNITRINGIIYTHAHADHINGIDDIRSFNYLANNYINAYGNLATLNYIESSFSYVFQERDIRNYSWGSPYLKKNIIEDNERIIIGDIEIDTFVIIYGGTAYSTDVSYLPDDSVQKLKAIRTWIVGCIDYKSTSAHAGLSQIIEWADIIKPEKVILTHMSHSLDYDKLVKELPQNFFPAYDGMMIK